MADKLNITRAQMLTAVVEQDYNVLATDDAIECAKRMLASISKNKPVSGAPTDKAIENRRLASQVYKAMPEGVPVLGSTIMASVNGIMTASKLTQVMRVLINEGSVERVPKCDKKGHIGYKRLPRNTETEE